VLPLHHRSIKFSSCKNNVFFESVKKNQLILQIKPIMTKRKIGIASDHAGYAYKEELKKKLAEIYEIIDYGTHSAESMDYPDVAHELAQSVSSGLTDMGIILCGSGNGVCMTVNKHQNIRGALCWDDELALLARQHNDANILCLPARFIAVEKAFGMAELFLNTPFEGGRHQKRVGKI